MRTFRRVMLRLAIGCAVILLAIVVLTSAFSGGVLADIGLIPKSERVNLHFVYEDVHSLNINSGAGTLLIRPGDTFEVSANNVHKNEFESAVVNGVWTIRSRTPRGVFFWPNIGIRSDSADNTITVTLPRDAVLKSCALTLGAGTLTADALGTGVLTVKVGAGEAVIRNLTAETVSADNGAGSIRIDGAITGNTAIKCGVGSVTINLLGRFEDYDYSVKVGVGSAKINDLTFAATASQTIRNPGSVGAFDINCGVGEIIVNLTP